MVAVWNRPYATATPTNRSFVVGGNIALMELVFARHGQSAANKLRIISNRSLPHDLTGLGRSQANALKEQINTAWLSLNGVYSSPVPRAWQTAQIVAAACPVTPSDALREIDCGVVEGRGDDEAWAIHDAVEDEWASGLSHARVPGGESLVDVQARFEPFIRAVVDRHRSDDGVILLVSHGTVLLQMLPRLVTNLDFEWARDRPLANCDTVRVEPYGAELVCRSWAGADLAPRG